VKNDGARAAQKKQNATSAPIIFSILCSRTPARHAPNTHPNPGTAPSPPIFINPPTSDFVFFFAWSPAE
jgi:hypothetical protein